MIKRSYATGELLVKFRSSPDLGLNRYLPSEGAEVVKVFDFGPSTEDALDGELALVSLPDGVSTEEALDKWAGEDNIEYVATNDFVSLQGPRDPIEAGKLNPKSWGLHNTGQTGGTPDADIDALEAWDVQTGRAAHSGGPLIAVVDTGIDFLHEALRDNVWTNPNEIPGDGIDNDGNGVVDDIHGYDARQENGFPLDDNGHGTHCAAIIGAVDGNSEKISGVMKRAQIAGVRFLSKLGMGKMSDAIEGLAYADRIGARIVSNSWGGGPFNPAMRDVLKSSPALHIFAAGNESNNNDYSPTYPANLDLPNVISVAATDHNDRLADFSSFGEKTVDIAAPGHKIYSAIHGGDYRELSGTSMAAPFVAGAAGLLVSEYPQISNEELKQRLLNSVDPLEDLQDKVRAGGRLNVARALEQDTVAPGRAQAFSVEDGGKGRVSLSFRPPGDDGDLGQASRYYIRMSEEPITPDNLAEALLVCEGRCEEPGALQKRDILLTRSGRQRTLHFALEIQDNAGNSGPLSLRSATLKEDKMLFEPGESTEREVWNGQWDFEQREVPGRGKVWHDPFDKRGGAFLRSVDISLANTESPKLVFEKKHDLSPGQDILQVQIGVRKNSVAHSWRTVSEISGTRDWEVEEIDLSRFKGKDIRVMFKTSFHGSPTQEGVMLDNIVVVDDTGANSALEARTPFAKSLSELRRG